MTDRIERMRELARGLREERIQEEPTMSVGVGGYTNAAQPPGAADGYNKPMDMLRRKSLGRWSRSLRKKKGES